MIREGNERGFIAQVDTSLDLTGIPACGGAFPGHSFGRPWGIRAARVFLFVRDDIRGRDPLRDRCSDQGQADSAHRSKADALCVAGCGPDLSDPEPAMVGIALGNALDVQRRAMLFRARLSVVELLIRRWMMGPCQGGRGVWMPDLTFPTISRRSALSRSAPWRVVFEVSYRLYGK